MHSHIKPGFSGQYFRCLAACMSSRPAAKLIGAFEMLQLPSSPSLYPPLGVFGGQSALFIHLLPRPGRGLLHLREYGEKEPQPSGNLKDLKSTQVTV